MNYKLKGIITQREDKDPYGILIDKLESLYIIYFEQFGIELEVISNFHINISEKLNKSNIDIVILSGGGLVDPRYYDGKIIEYVQKYRNRTENEIIKYALSKQIPIIGICRGMQQLNGYFGGKISHLTNLVEFRGIGVDHPVKFFKENIMVNNYHNDGIFLKDLSKEFNIISIDEKNNIVEGIYSYSKKIIAFQWHPERIFKHEKSKNKVNKIIKKFIYNGGRI